MSNRNETKKAAELITLVIFALFSVAALAADPNANSETAAGITCIGCGGGSELRAQGIDSRGMMLAANSAVAASDAAEKAVEKKCSLPDNYIKDNRLSLAEFMVEGRAADLTCGNLERAKAIIEAGEATVSVISVYNPKTKELVDGGMTLVEENGNKVVKQSFVGSGAVFLNSCYVTSSGHMVTEKMANGKNSKTGVSPVGNRVKLQRIDRYGNKEELLGTVIESLPNPNNINQDASLIALDRPAAVSRPMSALATEGVKILKEPFFSASYALDKQNGILPTNVVLDTSCLPDIERTQKSVPGGIIYTSNCRGSSASSGAGIYATVRNLGTQNIEYPMVAIPVRVDSTEIFQSSVGVGLNKGNMVGIDVRLFADKFRTKIVEDLAARRANGNNECPTEVK